MEEGSHRCGGASGDTSHYGVNCSSGDVVWRAERSPAQGVSSNTCTHTLQHAHTQRKLREHLDMCHLPRGSHQVYTQYRRGFVPSWMCNLHASLHHWERMEDEVESEERANQMTHFTGIMCLSKHGYCELGQEMGRNTHRHLPCRPLSCHHSCLFYSAAGPWSELPDGCLLTRATSIANQFTGIRANKDVLEFNRRDKKRIKN